MEGQNGNEAADTVTNTASPLPYVMSRARIAQIDRQCPHVLHRERIPARRVNISDNMYGDLRRARTYFQSWGDNIRQRRQFTPWRGPRK